jgi:hypothetical protein
MTEWESPYLDVVGETVEPPAFSNGTMFRDWQEEYCERCWHDREFRRTEEGGCDLLVLALCREPIPQWVYTDKPWPLHVHCIQFTPDDDGPDSGPPVPQATPPGQEVMFDPGVFDWDREREAVTA